MKKIKTFVLTFLEMNFLSFFPEHPKSKEVGLSPEEHAMVMGITLALDFLLILAIIGILNLIFNYLL